MNLGYGLLIGPTVLIVIGIAWFYLILNDYI